ncbi:PREDICTED: uncharacterized protein LOC104775214, partial [Camelina sativa]|uniref:Uncharacterized protein LOC104775214 n=1 Tax=Camelina sativa TaxID=90675 RepID=A0ABM0Y9R6_CAMSA
SIKWYGDVIWIFDPGIIGDWIDNAGEFKRCLLQTSVHRTGLRQWLRIWWKEIMLILILLLVLGNFNVCLWRCLHGTRFKRWYSSSHQAWALVITKKDVISYVWRCFVGMRCNGWIATIDHFKVYWSF